MSVDQAIAEMAVRVARAEMERDAALERERQAQDNARMAWRTYGAVLSGDKEKLLETLSIIGIPAKDLADIYEIEATWRSEGGSQSLLDWWRSARAPEEVAS